MDFNPYEILSVSQNAGPEFIENAYRFLSKKYHPDLNKAPDAHTRMIELNRAYQMLKDPLTRRKVDDQLAHEAAGQHRYRAKNSSESSYNRKESAANPKNETDLALQIANLTARSAEAQLSREWDAVVQFGEKLLKIAPRHQAIRTLTSAAYGARGIDQYQKGYYKWAINDFDRALQLDAARPDYYFYRGQSRFNQRSGPERPEYNRLLTEEAIADCSRALQLNPYMAEYYYVRSIMNAANDHREAAQHDLQRAADLDHPIAKKDLTQANSLWRRFISSLGLS